MPTLLDRLARKLEAKEDGQLRGEIAELTEERRTLLRSRPTFVEDAHAAVEEAVVRAAAAFRGVLDELATSRAPDLLLFAGANVLDQPLGTLACLYAASRPEFAAVFHEAVDRAASEGRLSTEGRAAFEGRVDKIAAAIDERTRELGRRHLDARREKLELELEQLGDGSTAVPDREPGRHVEVFDATGGWVGMFDERELAAWQQDTRVSTSTKRHNAAQDRPRVEFEPPTFRIVPLDKRGEDIPELAYEWTAEI